MKLRATLIVALLAITGGVATVARAQDDAAPMHHRMQRMERMMEDFDHAESAEQRRAIMREHMALMHEQMAEMHHMMGADAAEQGQEPDVAEMRGQMDMMQDMMTQMMAQQDMMMRMLEQRGGENKENEE